MSAAVRSGALRELPCGRLGRAQRGASPGGIGLHGLVEVAVEALLTRDKDKADAVIRGDRDIDILEVEVESLAIELLALQQPMARDLRFIISAIKISSDLERVGDHAVNIAQSALRLIALRSAVIPDPEIEDMARRARRMAAAEAAAVAAAAARPLRKVSRRMVMSPG